MQHSDVSSKRTAPAQETHAHARHCVQCRELLDPKYVALRASAVMCSDCSYDAVPCTD